MNAPDLRWDRASQSQRVLDGEFARIKRLLVQMADARPPADAGEARDTSRPPNAIDQLVDRFGLSAFERDLLLLTAGVQMDAEMGRLCASLAPPGLPPGASLGLAMACLPEPQWSAITLARPLRHWRLLELEPDAAPVSALLRIDERVLGHLAGVNVLDLRLRPYLRLVQDAPPPLAPTQQAAVQAVWRSLEAADEEVPLFQLHGDDPHGQCEVAAAVCAQAGLPLYAIEADDIPASPTEREEFAVLWEREVALLECALLVERADAAAGAAVRRLADRIHGVVFLSLATPLAVARDDERHAVDKPDAREQAHLWRAALPEMADGTLAVAADAASAFQPSAREIRRMAARVPQGDAEGIASAVRQAARSLERPQLEGSVQRIAPAVGWSDLLLPPQQMSALRQIASHMRHRSRVHGEWGFGVRGGRGLGCAVLFAGDSGTGKTLAAEVIARELGRDLLRIDLASVVSKYIGETEKNLSRIFEAAEASGAALLFDEADALFGRRSEVKDSHDRYANIEVSYLLQRMESYRGLAILTTNQKAALDPAFLRRLRMVLTFPFPDAELRQEIWRRAFPAAAPTEGIDLARLARLNMSGGQIRNIAIGAAFHAAEDGAPIRMGHLLRAARSEALKQDRPLADAEIRGWQ